MITNLSNYARKCGRFGSNAIFNERHYRKLANRANVGFGNFSGGFGNFQALGFGNLPSLGFRNFSVGFGNFQALTVNFEVVDLHRFASLCYTDRGWRLCSYLGSWPRLENYCQEPRRIGFGSLGQKAVIPSDVQTCSGHSRAFQMIWVLLSKVWNPKAGIAVPSQQNAVRHLQLRFL